MRRSDCRRTEAGTLLVAARRHQPAEERAVVNEAVGYELLGNAAQARGLANELRTAYPSNDDVVALWVRTAGPEVAAGRLIDEAGGLAGRSANVALSLSICLLNRDELSEAERYARTAIEVEPETCQGWLLLGQAVHLQGYRAAAAADRARLLDAAVGHYDRAAALGKSQGAAHIELGAVLNRAVVRAVRGDPAAAEDFAAAKSLAPRDPGVLCRHAVYLSDDGRPDRAVDEARAAAAVDAGRAAPLLAALLWDRNQEGDRTEATELAARTVRGPASARFHDALDIAVEGYLGAGRAGEAEGLLSTVPEDRLTPVGRDALTALIRHARGEGDASVEFARRAAGGVSDATCDDDLRRVCRVLTRLKLDDDALPILTRVANPTRLDPDTRMLLGCATRLGRHRVVLDVCRALRLAGAGDRRLLDLEIDLLQLHDRANAIAVLEDFTAGHPDDRVARLRLSVLALRSGRPELVDADPTRMPEVTDDLPVVVGRMAAYVLAKSGRWSDALAYAYDLLRRNLGDPDAHSMYCALCLHGERERTALAAPETVADGVAFAYRVSGDPAVRWNVVEGNDPRADIDEYPASHPRIRRALGLRVGDRFTLTEGAVQDREAEVVEILSKFVYRFRRSSQEYQERFPDRHDFQLIRLAQDGDDGRLDLTPIITSLDRRRDYINGVVRSVLSTPMPLHVFAEAIGQHLFDAMSALAVAPDVGVRWCCLGSPDEREAALRACRENRDTVLDLSGLFAVWRLGLAPALLRWKGRRFAITQTTHDRLVHLLDEEMTPGPRRRSAAREGGG